MSTFMGLEIGKRSIVAQQVALDVIGHNISNASTPGYSRQIGNLVTTRPWHAPVLVGTTTAGQMGTGVEVSDIQRYRDMFIDSQIRKEKCTDGFWKGMQDSFAQIEGILNEPTEDGLRGVMDSYWKSWQDLSGNGENESAREVVSERAIAMAESFNHAYQELIDLRNDVNASVKVKTDEINSYATQIRDLNKQIVAINITGKQPNDLLDKRDLLIDQLSSLVDIKVVNEPSKLAATDKTGIGSESNGSITILMGGRTLVQGDEVSRLACEQDGQGINLVVWDDTRMKADIEGGQLRGLLDMRGKSSSSQEQNPSEYREIIPTMINNLNTLAKTIIKRTNDLHRSGFSLNNKSAYPDGKNFFTEPDLANFDGNWARFMQVDSAITNDVKAIAAASNRTWSKDDTKVNFGDGSNALRIAQLKQDLNHPEYTVQTGDLAFNFPANAIAGDLTINYSDTTGTHSTKISLSPPTAAYEDIQKLAAAIQKQLDLNTTLINNKIIVKVRCDGKKLSFYSSSENFRGMSDGSGLPATNLLGGATFTAVSAATANGLVQDATADDYWRSICGNIGVQSQEATRMVKNQDQLISELETSRQSLSGVNMDEELTNMVKFQHAYNAASRFITAMDEQLETIVRSMGLVGR